MLQERREAIRKAQHEILRLAESQFATAQRMYVKLQNDYRASVEEVIINVVSTTRQWGGWRLWR